MTSLSPTLMLEPAVENRSVEQCRAKWRGWIMEGCSFLPCSIWIAVFIPMRFSRFHMQLQGMVGELGRDGTGGQLWRGGVVFCRWDVSSALWEGRQGSLGKAGAVCGPRQRQDPPLEQRCRRVTDAVFSKCRAICGDTLWVWIWDKCSCFSAFCFAFKREAPLFSATKAS